MKAKLLDYLVAFDAVPRALCLHRWEALKSKTFYLAFSLEVVVAVVVFFLHLIFQHFFSW
jgi:hypothetical protein